MVVRAHRGTSILLVPEVWISRLQAEGWGLVAAEPTDPEVTEPTPLASLPSSTVAAVVGTHAPDPVAAVDGPRRRARRGVA